MPQTVEQILERLQGGETFTFERTFTVDRGAIDEESRTVNVAFASDKPIDHWFGKLCLSMDKKAMRTERLKNGAPLLMDHRSYSWESQVGVIEGFAIGDDGVARADVRFSKSARGEEIFQDVRDGIRQCISVGFMIHEMHLEKQEKDKKKGDLYRSDDWEPYEISIVAVPADISVGVGRSAKPAAAFLPQEFLQAPERANPTVTERNMEPTENPTPAAPAVAATVRSADLIAADEIREWGRVLNEETAATEFIRSCQTGATPVIPTKEAFFAALRAKQPAPAPGLPPMDPRTAAEREGAPTVQLARTLPRFGRLKAFTGEGAEERAYRFGQFILGGPLGVARSRDFCQTNGIKLERAQSEGLNEKGGYFVPEDFGNDLIDLIEKYGVFRSNAKIRPMTRDTASDPRITGELDAYFVGESTAGTESDFETDRVSLTAKKLMTLVTYSSEVSEDAVISIGDEIARLSARAFAKKEDECGFNGTGASTYGGIVGVRDKLKNLSGTIANIAGLKVGTGNAYSELTLADFRGVVALLPEYADEGAKWFVHRSFYWDVMVGALLAAGGVTATEIENARTQQFLGYPVVFSQVMPKVEANSQVCALFGDLAMGATLGDRRSYTIAMSEHVRFTADDTVFKATSRFDINVHSVGNADATAANRVPGPIVGLITAAS
jgi:HK97 family phage major capsid protein